MRPVLVLVVALSLAAAPQPQSVGTSAVAGHVLDAATGQAIAGASVSLLQTRGGSGGVARLRLASVPHSDASEAITWLEAGSGAFTLLDVPAGSRLVASEPRFGEFDHAGTKYPRPSS